MQIVSRLSRSVCVCKPGFAKLTVDYSEDQRGQRIALSAINNAFGVHSDHIQDIVVSQARKHWHCQTVQLVVFQLLQCNTALKYLGPRVAGPQVLGSLVLGSSGPGLVLGSPVSQGIRHPPESNPLGMLEPLQCFWYPPPNREFGIPMQNSLENSESPCKIPQRIRNPDAKFPREFGISMQRIIAFKSYTRITSVMAPLQVRIQQSLETLQFHCSPSAWWKLLQTHTLEVVPVPTRVTLNHI